jgi:hypothetical protein
VDAVDQEAIDQASPAEEQLNELFGNYRAEWLSGRIFELFTEPAYFPELITDRPCALLGGRGTGKTTVLRGLSYEGQLALRGDGRTARPSTWQYYGLYYRVDLNRVSAFHGAELAREEWIRIFGHYLNLLSVGMVLRFLEWYGFQDDEIGTRPRSHIRSHGGAA